ncbi:MAG: acyltransferase family protein [Anaerolineae bacterium]|jgi:acyltransferase|nr:acyltransferase family protein [Anaerolineae bacterium]MBT7073287.1 acyltransferase family protein [Anaerolineae bacterium]
MLKKKTRYYWVDVAKVIGIFLIYYAHVLQRIYRHSTDTVFFQYKFFYAFHLPLFFFISGFFYKEVQGSKLTRIGILFQKRIFPFLLFASISILIYPIYVYLKFGEINFQFLFENVLMLFQGQSHINSTIWFLVCIFVVEIWAIFFLPKIKNVFHGLLLATFFLYFGYVLLALPEIEAFFIIPKYFWYIHESVLAFGFYAMGYSTFGWLKKLLVIRPLLRITLFLLFGWLTIWSIQLNSPSKDFVMVMKAAEHGNLYFFISAFSGILATLLLASFIPEAKWVSYIGKSTLILLGTNGLFISFFNSHLLDFLGHHDSTTWVVLEGVFISIITIGLSVPVIEILNKWFPQLLGKPHIDGPILKSISPPTLSFFRKIFDKISEVLGEI